MQWLSTDNLFHFYVGTPTGFQGPSDPALASIGFGYWHCYVCQRDRTANQQRIYRDGLLVASTNIVEGAAIVTGPAPQGAVGYAPLIAPSQPYTGDVGHWAIWNRWLNQAEVTSIWTAGGAAPAVTGNITQAATTGAFPTSYTLGAASAGLTGSGTIAVPNCVGALVNLTTVPVKWGKTDDIPTHYIPAVGRVQFSTLNGDDVGQLMHTPTQLIWAPNRMSQFLRYFLRAGVTATITPIVSAQ